MFTMVPALGPSWLDPQSLIDSFGTWALLGIMVVIFVEVGLLFPILPGDSLLFTAGALVASKELDIGIGIVPLSLILVLTAFAGTQSGYGIGRFVGTKLFDRPDGRIFKRKHIDMTHAYFDKYGGRTLVIAQFIPFVRTYASVAAGVGRMPYRHFVKFNSIGVVLWAGGVTWLGYLLGRLPFVAKNIEALLVLIVLVSVSPVIVEVLRERRKRRAETPESPQVPESAQPEEA
ncbi:MAG: VTT domain-containing protein [Micrococcales bacterium]|nr:VTT domain-containing protein [Micrococcales bacterium]MCL2667151.1 VTT domain-containing protein [Micrococcales bacterium]